MAVDKVFNDKKLTPAEVWAAEIANAYKDALEGNQDLTSVQSILEKIDSVGLLDEVADEVSYLADPQISDLIEDRQTQLLEKATPTADHEAPVVSFSKESKKSRASTSAATKHSTPVESPARIVAEPDAQEVISKSKAVE